MVVVGGRQMDRCVWGGWGGGRLIIQEGHWRPQEIALFIFFPPLSNSGCLNNVFAASGRAKEGGAKVREWRRSRWTLSARSKADHLSCSGLSGPSASSRGG